jgi:hypothetical protein
MEISGQGCRGPDCTPHILPNFAGMLNAQQRPQRKDAEETKVRDESGRKKAQKSQRDLRPQPNKNHESNE